LSNLYGYAVRRRVLPASPAEPVERPEASTIGTTPARTVAVGLSRLGLGADWPRRAGRMGAGPGRRGLLAPVHGGEGQAVIAVSTNRSVSLDLLCSIP
jgi:hypothetical protein